MQGKGLIRFFLVVMILVTAYQFLLVLPTLKVEGDAESHADTVSANAPTEQKETVRKMARVAYLDSMSTETVLSIPLLKEYTYQDLKGQQLAYGLDLKGGMSVVLQVDLREFVKKLADDSNAPPFLAALDQATIDQKNSQSDFVTLFANAWSTKSNGMKLAEIFSLNEGLREEINSQTSDSEVIAIVREKANQTVDLTFKRLKERIDKFGVSQPNVSLDAGRDLILVELPGVDNPERARQFLKASAQLEFWKVHRITDGSLSSVILRADEKLKSSMGDSLTVETTVAEPIINERKIFERDTLGNVADSTKFETVYDTLAAPVNPADNFGPLLKIFQPNQGNYSFAVLGSASKNKRNAVMAMLSRPEIQSMFPNDLKLQWGYKPIRDRETNEVTREYLLYMIKTGRDGAPPLEGDRITKASVQPDPTTGEVQVSLEMDGQGTQVWGELTTDAARNQNREIAISLDGEIVSAPTVNEPILSGRSSISGGFSQQEAQDLSNILEIGKLPADIKIIQEALVGPTLGQDNINRSLTSMAIGFLLVMLFMILYYGGGGIVSIIALMANLFFIFGALASIGTVLTLPGVAGIILTVGMAVDANVIIYERIREELRTGKALTQAISDGFRHSYSAIIDANVTTILVAFVLFYFGMGPIKGFAAVLIVGVISSVFAAVLIGRLIIDWWVGKGNNLSFSMGWSRNVFADLNIDWLGKRKMAYMISGTVIVLGIISMFARGFDLGVDFRGGYSYTVQFDKNVSVDSDKLRAALTPVFGDEPIVKTFDSANTYSITTTEDAAEVKDDKIAEQIMGKLHEGVNGIIGGSLNIDDFKNPSFAGTHVTASNTVGPTIADDIRTSSIYATIFALLLIFLYIFIRFRKWQFSLGAVAALFHDVLVVLSVFSILWGFAPWSMEVDQAFIAALLTVVGYSINDTVVVFDRIREYLDTYSKKDKYEVINMAVNSTVSRTIITSVTTIFVVLILFVFGSGSIKGFAWALVVGVVVGTYSSIFVATPIVHDFSGDMKPKEAEDAKSNRFSKALK